MAFDCSSHPLDISFGCIKITPRNTSRDVINCVDDANEPNTNTDRMETGDSEIHETQALRDNLAESEKQPIVGDPNCPS